MTLSWPPTPSTSTYNRAAVSHRQRHQGLCCKRPWCAGFLKPPPIILLARSLRKYLCSSDGRRCGLIEATLKSRMFQLAPPENGSLSDERISRRRWCVIVSIESVSNKEVVMHMVGRIGIMGL